MWEYFLLENNITSWYIFLIAIDLKITLKITTKLYVSVGGTKIDYMYPWKLFDGNDKRRGQKDNKKGGGSRCKKMKTSIMHLRVTKCALTSCSTLSTFFYIHCIVY